MKNVFVSLVIFLSVIGGCSCQVVSRVRTLSSDYCSQVLLRIYGYGSGSGNNTLMYYDKGNALYPHRFVYISSSLYGKEYIMPLLSNQYGSISYTVADMQIVGRKCFFCGKMTYSTTLPEEPPLPPDRTSNSINEGYVAIMSLDSIDADYMANVKVQFSKIVGTSEVTKMAIRADSPDTLIGLIGLKEGTGGESCLVTMKGGGNSWENYVYAFPDTTETLTDIAIGEKSLITTSRFGGETWTFGVRYLNCTNIFEEEILEYCNGMKFDTENCTVNALNQTSRFTWHYNSTPIRLLAMPNGNDATVSYEGCYIWIPDSDNVTKYISSFYIDGNAPNDIFVSDANRIWSYSEVPNTFADMKYAPSINSIALLCNPKTANDQQVSTVSLFSWGSTTCKFIQSYTQKMETMHILSNKLWAGGWHKTYGWLVQCYEDLNNISFNTCLDANNSSVAKFENMPEREPNYVNLRYKENGDMIWEFCSRVLATDYSYEQTCVDFMY